MFDYIIVGGGSAGSVLAGRLSEDPAIRVALIEAGPADRSVLIHCPAGLALLVKWAKATLTRGATPQLVGASTDFYTLAKLYGVASLFQPTPPNTEDA